MQIYLLFLLKYAILKCNRYERGFSSSSRIPLGDWPATEPGTQTGRIPTDIDRIVYNYAHKCDELPQETVQQFLNACTDEERTILLEKEQQHPGDLIFVATRWHFYMHSLAETTRLGLFPHPDYAGNPIVIAVLGHQMLVTVDAAKGETAGIALAEKWEFEYSPPEAMWYTMASRRDGNALIGFCGDDRGWNEDWEYYIVVGWDVKEWTDEQGFSLCQIMEHY